MPAKPPKNNNGNSRKPGSNTLRRKIGDDAVKTKTGKNWNDWFALLDQAGAKKMTHKEIVKWIGDRYGRRDWWWQMITATYERREVCDACTKTLRGMK